MKLKGWALGVGLIAASATVLASDAAAPVRLTDLTAWPETMQEGRKATPLGQFGLTRVTQLQLKAGGELSAHSAPERVLVIVLSGQGSFDFNGEVVALRERQVMHMHPGEMHSVKAETDMELLLVRVDEAARDPGTP